MIRLPSAADPAVSVIVLLDGAVEMAERCLQAVAAADDAVPFETIVLLNDPDPGLESFVRAGTTGAKVVLSRANAGTGVGWNLGTEVAAAPRIATLHEDSEPDAGWLAALCRAMSEHDAGVVGSRLYRGDGGVQNCGWVLFSDGSPLQIEQATAPEVVASTAPTPADMVSGAAMLVDRELIRAVGGWDERFHPAVFGDIDISIAAWSRGRLVLSVPASGVRHEGGAFDRRPNSPLTGPRLRNFLFERHRDRFLAKWGSAVRELAAADFEPWEREAHGPPVQAGLAITRERAERVRAGDREPFGRTPSAERRYSGIAEPVLDRGDGTFAVAAEVEEALRAAERTAIDGYCLWLARREEETYGQLLEAHERGHQWLKQHDEETSALRAQIGELQNQNRELATTLDRILHGNTWRLRGLVLRILRGAATAARRAFAALRG
jgi:GT2 family glycosyltransferase